MNKFFKIGDYIFNPNNITLMWSSDYESSEESKYYLYIEFNLRVICINFDSKENRDNAKKIIMQERFFDANIVDIELPGVTSIHT